jgi:hypothetical protein
VRDPDLDASVAALVARLGPARCQRVPLEGLGVVSCR